MKLLPLFGIKTKKEEGNDNYYVSGVFNVIKNSFNLSLLSRYDSGPWGYYLRYSDFEIGFKSIRINGVIKNITQTLQDEILNFFESKGKGTVRECGI